MKKSLFTLVLMAFAVFNGFAQDDDVYFVPTKKAKKSDVSASQVQTASSYEVISSGDSDDNWYVGRSSGRDVDEYNRRGSVQNENTEVVVTDEYADDDVEYAGNGTYTARIVRFHAPGAVIIASPWYWDYYDTYFYDPWYGYSWRSYYGLYRPWGWSWSIGWSYPYYGYYGWHRPYYGWYGSWHYGYGWGRPHHAYNSWAWRPPHHGPAYTDYRRGWGSGRNLGRNGGRDNRFGLSNERSSGRYGNSRNNNSGGRFGGNSRTVEAGQRGRLGGSTIGTGSHSLGSRPTTTTEQDNGVRNRPVRNAETGVITYGSSNSNGRSGITTGNSNRGRTFGSGTQTNSSQNRVTTSSSTSRTPTQSSKSSSSDIKVSRPSSSSSSSGSGRSFGSSSSSSGRSFGSSSSSSGGGRSFGGGGGGGSHSSGGGRGFGGRR